MIVIIRGNHFSSTYIATTLSARNASFVAHPLPSRIRDEGGDHDLHYRC